MGIDAYALDVGTLLSPMLFLIYIYLSDTLVIMTSNSLVRSAMMIDFLIFFSYEVSLQTILIP